MMQKLTKKQLDWLLAEFRECNWISSTGDKPFIAPREMPAIERLLRQCTEVPNIDFPTFSFAYGFLEVSCDKNNYEKFIQLDVGDCGRPLATRWFTQKEFKEIAEGFNKLVELLNA